MPQHAGTDVHNGPPATLFQRKSRTSSHEQIHYKAKKLEKHTFNTTRKTQCSEEGTKGQYLDDQSAQTNQAAVSNASPTSYTISPQSNHKNSDSTFQCVRLNASIKGYDSYEPRKQFSIGLAVEHISPMHRMAASA